MITPIILSGGSGKRLWPLSQKNFPKQFLKLSSNLTLFQETLLRASGANLFNAPIIVCNNEHRFIVVQQCQEIGINEFKIIVEPVSRNTAPAIIAAVITSSKNYSDKDFLVLPSDHYIDNELFFKKTIENAYSKSLNNTISIFGVKPDSPNSNYGYIKYFSRDGNFVFDKFVEKPSKEAAKTLLDTGTYLWNSGMFLFRGSTLVNEINQYNPELLNSVIASVKESEYDLDFIRLGKNSFEKCPNISIDYALLEKTKKISLFRLNLLWRDLGTLESIYNSKPKDSEDNYFEGNVENLNSKGSMVLSKLRKVITLGIKNIFIIDTKNYLLIGDKEELKKKSSNDFIEKFALSKDQLLSKVYRPWGSFIEIYKKDNYQVKKLHINPKSKLSLQKHRRRSEHWVVVTGVADVQNGDKVIELSSGDSTYIPCGVKHSIANNSENPLEIIEIQTGDYLGEDDIVRYEDLYGRVNENE